MAMAGAGNEPTSRPRERSGRAEGPFRAVYYPDTETLPRLAEALVGHAVIGFGFEPDSAVESELVLL